MTIGPLGRPAPDASPDEMRKHFVQAGAVMAMLPYDIAIHTCEVCGMDGENTHGKDKNPGGRHRVCSVECEAVFDANQARMRPVALLQEEEKRGGKKARRLQVDDSQAAIGEGEERGTGDAREES